ncbi:hypothetical protein PACTADRAFT_32750 [Pachysolen tannophilus NRRL Y-2460]|uniref:N-terminal of MaoC-like dehydratase domain-containing protein n=1 Tax=Pachysolen tannophilus NRRL Y-2460 TaxID=669874 RepID=A0A1E4TZW1_PACTA|nr:hypothetical protein PACTADRAFT_32750 [Pachysolen tannophilus NRRL Y-2460]
MIKDLINLKQRLLSSRWTALDESLSLYPSRQLKIVLQSILNTSDEFPHNTNKVPPGYHFAYLNSLTRESELSKDGYESYQAPTVNKHDFFRRRLWVGGELSFSNESFMRFHEECSLSERIRSYKIFGEDEKDLEFKSLVEIERSFRDRSGNICLTELRKLMYVNNTFNADQQQDQRTNFTMVPDRSIIIKPTTTSLLRYSCVTFNAHKIHYDLDYTRNVEKYPNLLIHGPLSINLLLEFFLNNTMKTDIKKFSYKNHKPMFLNNEFRLNYKKIDDLNYRLWIDDTGGRAVFVDGKLKFYS